MYDAKREVSSLLACHVEGLDSQQIYEMLEVPPNPEMGDLALPCFKLSRILRKSPVQIAEELAAVIPQDEQIERIESVSGYLNFFLNRSLYIREVLAYALKTGESYGSSDKGKGKTIVIDYSSPNIAKPFHVGHLRSTSIGNSLYRIFEFTGYRCVGINYLGDWGTQFGKLITAYKHWGSEEAVKEGMIKELVALYVRFHQEAEEDPSLEDEARQWFVRLEQGDEEARRLWQWFIDISMEEYQKVLSEMISATSTEHAPWYVLPADKKWWGRFRTMQILIHHLEMMDPKYPKPSEEFMKNLDYWRKLLDG